MRVMNHNWSATKQRLHPQSVVEISHHSVLSDQITMKAIDKHFQCYLLALHYEFVLKFVSMN